MHVVVTGAAGFIGTHVVSALLSRGDEVVGVDRHDTVGTSTTTTPSARYTHIRADLSDPGDPRTTAWRRAVRRADGVVHLAARPGVRATGVDVEAARARDILGTTDAVLSAAARHTAVVVASSSAVYGPGRSGRGSTEADTIMPISSYGRWKAAVEARCARHRRDGGVVGVARPFTVAGPGQRPDMAIALWLDAVLNSRAVTVFGDLDRSRDITDVTDVANGLIAMIDLTTTGESTTLNLGAGHPWTHRQVIAAIESVTGTHARLDVREAHPDDVARTWADPRRAADLIDWHPTQDLAAIITRQIGGPQPAAHVPAAHVSAAA